jgi:actin-related protein
MSENKLWEKLFNQKLKEVMLPSNKYHFYATLSPTANGSCARELIAEEYYQQQSEIEALKTKTLTEDEIKECADSVCHAWKKNGVGELYMEDFARAILRKANEK